MLTLESFRLLLAATMFVSLVLALTLTYNAGMKEVSARAQQEERQLEISIPKHVPLRIKIKEGKEQGFKDVNNENWARDFELEVTNIGTKPIYSMAFVIFLDVKAAEGFRIVTPVSYGRAELSDHRVRATTDDIPIEPGDSWSLKIDPGQVGVWARKRQEEGRPLPKKVQVRFQNLSFGDGTGLMGPAGTPVPRKISAESNLRKCGPKPNNEPRRLAEWLAAAGPPNLKQLPGLQLPASFLPVNFLMEDSPGVSLKRESVPDCCPTDCTSLIFRQRVTCDSCPLEDDPTITYCGDPDADLYE